MHTTTITPGIRRGRRATLSAAAAVAVLATLAWPAVRAYASAKASGPTLVVYSAQGYDSAVVTAFNKTNPGFTVTLNDNSTGPLLQQIQAEGSHPKWGVLWVDGSQAFAALDRQGKLLRGIVPKVPFNAVGRANIARDGSFVPTGLTATGALVYDSSQISAAKLPKTWADLLKPEYAHMLGMNDPTQSGPTYPLIAGLMNYLGHYTHGSTAAAVKAGEAYFAKLKHNGLVINATNGPTLGAIQSHTIAMAIIQSSAGYGAEISTSPTMRVAYLNPVTALPGTIGIDRLMPVTVQKEARRFVDYVLSPAGQHVMQTGDPQGDSLFWPVLKGETPANKVIPALASVPMQTTNPYVWGPLENQINAWFTKNITNG